MALSLLLAPSGAHAAPPIATSVVLRQLPGSTLDAATFLGSCVSRTGATSVVSIALDCRFGSEPYVTGTPVPVSARVWHETVSLPATLCWGAEVTYRNTTTESTGTTCATVTAECALFAILEDGSHVCSRSWFDPRDDS